LEALATWPPDIRDMASRLYEIGLPAHRLPLFGKWLFSELSPSTDLAAAVPTQAFCGMVKQVMARVPGAPRAPTAHSMRRGGATSMFFNKAELESVALALRHTSTLSTKCYVSDSAKAEAIAITQRAVSRGGRLCGGGTDLPDRGHPRPGDAPVGVMGVPVRRGQRPDAEARPVGARVLGGGDGRAYS